MDLSAAFEKRFIDTLGLNTAALGRATLERIVRAGLKRSGVENTSAYLELLSTSPAEFERCIEEIVVSETWFFRDTEPFVLLKQHLCSQWFPSRPEETVRILSVPCSTGEEPYSIAITLLEAGIQPDKFHLDATDISYRALAAAERAVYGKRAFRQPLTITQGSFFTGPPEERQLDDAVVRTVHFFRDNLVDPRFLSGQRPYDFIFCRNVLIYLTDAARRRVIETIGRLLAHDGILFTGHAEMGILLQQGFTPIQHARAFACRRTGVLGERGSNPLSVPEPPIPPRHPLEGLGSNSKSVPKPPGRVAASPPKGAAMKPLPSVSARTSGPAPESPTRQLTASETLHEKALALADRGLFDEAAALCRRSLRERRPHADGYSLLGLIHEAARQMGEAEECYLKALYLDPDHYETLIHLSFLYRQQGDDRKALLYRQRADTTGRRPNGTFTP